MSTNEKKRENVQPLTPEEIAQAAASPLGDPELDEIPPAEIEELPSEAEPPPEQTTLRGRRLPPERARRVVQSLLFVSDRPLSVEQLVETIGCDRSLVETELAQLCEIHREGSCGIVLQEVAGGWQLRTDSSSAEYVRRFLQIKPQRLTRAALETLAIVAYRQPITRPEIEDVRGVDSGAVVKALLERKLLKILGKKEEVGRPILYGTSREFLEFFALKDLASLPTLREFQELTQEHQDIVETEAPQKPAVAPLADLVDPDFQSRLESGVKESEAALSELEQAITAADRSAKKTVAALSVPAEQELVATGVAPR